MEKKSHLTVPITHGVELHLEKKDFGNVKHKVGQKVNIKMPMITTSLDAGHARFKQAGKVKPELPKDKLKRVVKKMLKNKENY